jgi:deoxyadenosine/deoxycytidine kinase
MQSEHFTVRVSTRARPYEPNIKNKEYVKSISDSKTAKFSSNLPLYSAKIEDSVLLKVEILFSSKKECRDTCSN